LQEWRALGGQTHPAIRQLGALDGSDHAHAPAGVPTASWMGTHDQPYSPGGCDPSTDLEPPREGSTLALQLGSACRSSVAGAAERSSYRRRLASLPLSAW